MRSSFHVLLLLVGRCGHVLANEQPSQHARQRPSWQAKLSTYSIASIARREGRRDWNEVTQGNKVVLPREVYDLLSSRGLPLDKFQLLNPERKRALRLFTGPLDFCAASGECYLPSWVMRQLGIKEGELCAVATACFPPAAYIKFQPHTSEFLDIGDHGAVLTRTIENLGGLTAGSFVRVSDGQRTYTLDVLEVRGKPMPPNQRDDSNGRAVSIGLLECPIDFAEPKDIAMAAKKAAKKAAEASSSTSTSCSGHAGRSEPSQAPQATTPARTAEERAIKRASSGERSASTIAKSSANGSANGSVDPKTAAAPMPKFKRRREAAAAGEGLAGSPFSGRSQTLGKGDTSADGNGEYAGTYCDGSSGTPTAQLRAKRRAAAKRDEEKAHEQNQASGLAGSAAAEEEVYAPPGLLLLVAKLLSVLREVLRRMWAAACQLLTPGDVSFD